MNNKIKYNCIFGGGGIRGMCYIGAVKALKELDIEIGSIAGSSVGAVFAALFAVGYDENEIKELFLDFNINMFRDININIFTTDISLSKGEIFLEWLREKIELKVFGENYIKNKGQKVRFKDIEKDLYILTIDLNTNAPYIFSKSSTPDEEIALAVRASASLPGLMKPVNTGNLMLVDGDLIKSWPAWKIYEDLNTSQTRILEFRLEGSRDGSDIKNPMDYINSIINTIWYLSTENVFNTFNENDRYDYIVIDTKDVILFDFTIDKEIKNSLIEKGYQTTKEYLTKTLVNKKSIVISKYKNILDKVNIIEKNMVQKKIDDILPSINDIMSEMHEDAKYVDIYIYELIRTLKNSVKSNIKKPFILPQKLDNYKQIKEKTEFIKKITEEKIQELTIYIKNFGNKC